MRGYTKDTSGIQQMPKKNVLGNNTNRDYYDSIPINETVVQARQLGIHECKDVDAANKLSGGTLYSKPQKILELGAGTGRVVTKLLSHMNRESEIIAIERTSRLAGYLSTNFREEPRVAVIQMDMLTGSIPKADSALLFWGNIMMFNPEEQMILIKRILDQVDTLIIDCPEITRMRGKSPRIRSEDITNWGTLVGWDPDPYEWGKMLQCSSRYPVLNGKAHRISYLLKPIKEA